MVLCVLSVASFHCVIREGLFKEVTFKTLNDEEGPGAGLWESNQGSGQC